MEIFLVYEMVMEFVFFCFKLLWKLFSATQNLGTKLEFDF